MKFSPLFTGILNDYDLNINMTLTSHETLFLNVKHSSCYSRYQLLIAAFRVFLRPLVSEYQGGTIHPPPRAACENQLRKSVDGMKGTKYVNRLPTFWYTVTKPKTTWYLLFQSQCFFLYFVDIINPNYGKGVYQFGKKLFFPSYF